ncbi:MAG: hypothetical protein BroJett024_16090 [Alphaproteobacteria bacterium]|nr:MAG: hypothetical protein BroJett024_16090 [Alphaproteobacteria bacterium]
MAAHGHARQPERQVGREPGEHGLGPLPAGGGIGDHADRMTARDLLAREIDDVPEQASHGGAQDMEDAQR